jgi:hypothetical protein
MIVKLKGGERCGKGLVMVRLALHFLRYSRIWRPENCITNFDFHVNGTHRLDVEHMIGFMQRMIQGQLNNMMLLIQEADREFPPQLWQKPDQFDALIGCWQTEKLNNLMIIDCHWGDVNILLRRTVHIEIMPKYHPDLDLVECGIIDIVNHRDPVYRIVPHISRVFPWYKSFKPVT